MGTGRCRAYAAPSGMARRSGGASGRWYNALVEAARIAYAVIASSQGYIGVEWHERPVMSLCTTCLYERATGLRIGQC